MDRGVLALILLAVCIIILIHEATPGRTTLQEERRRWRLKEREKRRQIP